MPLQEPHLRILATGRMRMTVNGEAKASHDELLKLTTTIVSAHLGHQHSCDNGSIRRDPAGLRRLEKLGQPAEPVATRPDPAVLIKKSVTPDYLGLPGGRQEAQDAEAASRVRLQHDAGSVPRALGIVGGLSDGRAELRPAAQQPGEVDRPGSEPSGDAGRAGARSGERTKDQSEGAK